jgi:hypothetical protein
VAALAVASSAPHSASEDLQRRIHRLSRRLGLAAGAGHTP